MDFSNRHILHSDLNCFYASVEIMLDPSLRGKAVAVCGSSEDRHGIVLAKSEKAKKAGVKTGMVNMEAKALCKDLILVPPQYDQYLKYSKLTREIYYRYTDLVEPFGMDECWLDVTGSYIYGSPVDMADEIRKSVYEELGLTVSVGVSFNKIFAKLGSDLKKPDATTVISKEDFKEKIWPLKCSEIIYCGRATTRKLNLFGIYTLGNLANADPAFLKNILGVNGLYLWSYANGFDHSRVEHRNFVSPVKSIGHGITCVSDLENETEVYKVMLQLSQDVGHRLRVHEMTAGGVCIYIRGNDLNFSQFQCKLPVRTQLPSEIAHYGFDLFLKKYDRAEKVRAVCIRAIDLAPKDQASQISIFDDIHKRIRREELEGSIEDIRERFGKKSVTYAVLLGDLKMPDDGRDKVRMPSSIKR